MESVNDIRNELRGMNSALTDMPRTMPYEVPVGYFESFTDGVGLLKAGKEMPHEVPQGYFEQLADDILFEVNKPSVAFTVPEGYFEALPAEILAKVKQADRKPMTIPIGIRIWKNVRWAAAAVLILGIGLGVYRSYWYEPAFNVQEELASVSQEVIDEYVQLHIDEFDMETIATGTEPFDIKPATNHLSSEEIENYINESGLDESVLN
jgi:hypothetical protein